jgi:hypothetical protein
VGEFKNELGFSDPNRIKFTMYLDRPVAEAVRDAVIVELKHEGYEIGKSPYKIFGMIESFVSPPNYTVIQFNVLDKENLMILYDKRVRADANVMGVFDEKGHVQEVQQCIRNFLNDPDFKLKFPLYVRKVKKENVDA